MTVRPAMSGNVAVEPAYVAHQKIYPREVGGRFARLRVAAVLSLLGLYYILPWIRWDARQAVLFDLPARKFYIFSLAFWPQDFIFLSWLLIIAALSLFFFTALAGRLWCGFACPQTVWTEVFVWLERLAEGKRAQRMKLDRAPWSAAKLGRKTLKYVLWTACALWTGFTFVGYFTPIGTLAREILAGTPGPWELFWILFYGFATFGNAGLLREQVCKYMCPYARFQSAMFDRHTLIISYDEARGEPRGARQRASNHRSMGLGDCIDCTLCVQVCPTGIDIRAGLQYECIACAACIDACDGVMDRMGYARGLIRYATEAGVQGRRAKILRPRMILYGSALAVLIVGFVTAIALRNPIAIDVLHDRNGLYRVIGNDTVENVYLVRLLNKDEHAHRLALSARGLPGLQLDTDDPRPWVGGGQTLAIAVRLRAPQSPELSISNRVFIRASQSDGTPRYAESTTRFIAPQG